MYKRNHFWIFLFIIGISSLFGCSTVSRDGHFISSLRNIAGGRDSGGGNVRKSTKEDVEKAIAKLKPRLALAFRILGKNLSRIQSREISEILALMYANDSMYGRLYKILDQSKYLPMNDCDRYSDKISDAGTRIGDSEGIPSDVCFSVSRLMGIPREALDTELLALAAHEHAHHFGFLEDKANMLQDFFLGSGQLLIQINYVRKQTKDLLQDFIFTTKRTALAIERENPLSICWNLGEMKILSSAITSSIYNGRMSGEFAYYTDEIFQARGEIEMILDSTFGLCQNSIDNLKKNTQFIKGVLEQVFSKAQNMLDSLSARDPVIP